MHGRLDRNWALWRRRGRAAVAGAPVGGAWRGQLQAGDPGRARRTLVEAQALASGAGDPVLAASVAARIPRLTRFLVPDRELESLLTGALEGLGGAEPVLRARLLARRAVIAEDAEDRRAAQRPSRPGRAAAR